MRIFMENPCMPRLPENGGSMIEALGSILALSLSLSLSLSLKYNTLLQRARDKRRRAFGRLCPCAFFA
jgi:hypothetical protein